MIRWNTICGRDVVTDVNNLGLMCDTTVQASRKDGDSQIEVYVLKADIQSEIDEKSPGICSRCWVQLRKMSLQLQLGFPKGAGTIVEAEDRSASKVCTSSMVQQHAGI